MRPRLSRGLSTAPGAVWCAGWLIGVAYPAWAQVEPPLPPRIIDEPGEAILASLPEERQAEMEEIVVIGEELWRLPDLGQTWRAENEAPKESRLVVGFLPLYDPEATSQLPDLSLINTQEDRVVSYIELFRVRFGAKPSRTTVPTLSEPSP